MIVFRHTPVMSSRKDTIQCWTIAIYIYSMARSTVCMVTLNLLILKIEIIRKFWQKTWNEWIWNWPPFWFDQRHAFTDEVVDEMTDHHDSYRNHISTLCCLVKCECNLLGAVRINPAAIASFHSIHSSKFSSSWYVTQSINISRQPLTQSVSYFWLISWHLFPRCRDDDKIAYNGVTSS